MARKLYVLKIRSAHTLPNLITLLQENRIDVVSLREHSDEGAAPTKRTRKAPVTAIEHVNRAEAARRRNEAHLANVHTLLAPILQANPYAPVERVVALLNETSARTTRGTKFTNDNVRPYIDYSLEKLTSPTPDCIA